MYRYLLNNANFISIHAPRGGSDPSSGPKLVGLVHFNPRSPRGERPNLDDIYAILL